jgi:hypothetical protein
MDYRSIIVAIDAEIAKLTRVRSLLAAGEKLDAILALNGASKKVSIKNPAKRVMSPEARERIAAAQRKRWAKTRRAAKRAGTATVNA